MGMTRTGLRFAAVLVFALGTSACSTIDDMIGDDGATPPADNNGFPPDSAPPPPSGDVASAGAPAPAPAGSPLTAGTEAAPGAATGTDAAPGALPPATSSTTPDLASVPEKPSGTTTPDEQRELADSLGADRSRTTYSADALRGGTEAAAAPPGAAPEPVAVASASPPPAPIAPAPAAPAAAVASSSGGTDTTPPPAPTAPVSSAPMPAVASSAPPSGGGKPAVPAVPAMGPAGPTGDVALGFKPSTAPALDPSISQFVAQPIITRYQQTAANAGIATGTVAPTAGGPAVPPLKRTGRAVGGPEAMTGSVVANLDALNDAPPSVYANVNGMPPAAVVMFPGDTTALSAAGRAQVRAAVDAFQARGGVGFIKVVGHSSSRTANMPVEKHLVEIFAKSQKRAQAVAAELIRQGVPASKVLVEAVGDSQPVYYESMPQGEDGNRRAEIFLQN
jgi:outer membrane protein OmpA-like peptidoglycan-associated protein